MNEVYKGKDAPGHIEFFPVDSSEGFAVNGGIRIGGENNWGSHDQKALTSPSVESTATTISNTISSPAPHPQPLRVHPSRRWR